jgi:hypothetical protein
MLRRLHIFCIVFVGLISHPAWATIGDGCFETYAKAPEKFQGQTLPGVVICISNTQVAIIAPNDGPVAFCEHTKRIENQGRQTTFYFENGDTMIFETELDFGLKQGRFTVGSTEANFIQVGLLAAQNYQEKILNSGACH